jgi:predicted dehydrogenase
LPTYLHAKWTIRALKAGKHVICEKPMALSSLDARKMVSAARQANRRLFIGHCIRFWPAYEVARKIIQSGAHGRVHSAVFARISPKPGWSWRSWLLNPKLSGNAALDLHIHDADFVLYLFGRPKSVCSHGSGSSLSGFEHIVTSYNLGKGNIVIAEGGWGYKEQYPFSMTFRVAMEKASLALHADGKLMLYQSGREPKNVNVPAGDGYSRELAHFIDCLAAGRKSNVVSPESAMQSVQLVEAEIKSAATGKTIRFNLDISSRFMKYPPFGLRRARRSVLAQDYPFGATKG